MDRLFRITVFVVCFIAFSSSAHTHAATDKITDLAYSVQDGNSLYFTGKYQGKPVNLVRKGVIGAGKWTIYTGTPTDRVRLTIDDKKGLQEVLAMDKGERIAINLVRQERVEYRLYAPDRKFVIGSVLYRSKKRWLQGIMKTEAFPGYHALKDVSDVTGKFTDQYASREMTLSDRLLARWQELNLISTANAAEGDSNWISDFFSAPAQDARNRWNAPLHEMFKGSLVGAAAFTVKLVGQTIASGEAAAAGSAVVIGAPLVAAVGAGVAIGLAADRVYNWVAAKDLSGSTSLRDIYNRLVEPPIYDEEAPAEAPSPSPATSRKTPSPRTNIKRPSESLKDLVEMSAKLDKEDFNRELELAEACTNNRDLACAKEHIAKAVKLAGSYTDNQLIDEARSNMSRQKKRIEEEARQHTETAGAGTADNTCNGGDSALVGNWNCRDGYGETATFYFSSSGSMTDTQNTNSGGTCDSNRTYTACGGKLTTTGTAGCNSSDMGVTTAAGTWGYAFQNGHLVLQGYWSTWGCTK